jgi:hypothetical protein
METQVESSKLKRIANRFKNWRSKNEELWFAGNFLFWIGLATFLLLFTAEGHRIFEQLVDFYSTPLGTFLFWFLVIVVGLFGVSIYSLLYDRYGWFRHLFWLGMIGGWYFIGDSKITAGIFAAFYWGTLMLPKIWEALSNELADKVVEKLELLKKPGG